MSAQVAFRNVDGSSDDDVRGWPFEALTAALGRGLVRDWRPLLDEVRRHPWGSFARRMERAAASVDDRSLRALVDRAIRTARAEHEQAERDEVARRVRGAVERSGLTASGFAAEIGTSPSRLSTYMTGRVTPSAAMLVRIERVAGDTSGGPA
jgi:hypothetical protein